jgi:hypothetical protein
VIFPVELAPDAFSLIIKRDLLLYPAGGVILSVWPTVGLFGFR